MDFLMSSQNIWVKARSDAALAAGEVLHASGENYSRVGGAGYTGACRRGGRP